MTMTTDEQRDGISSNAWQLGWLLREMGVGVVASPEGIKLVPYDGTEAHTREVAAALVSSLSSGWSAADQSFEVNAR